MIKAISRSQRQVRATPLTPDSFQRRAIPMPRDVFHLTVYLLVNYVLISILEERKIVQNCRKENKKIFNPTRMSSGNRGNHSELLSSCPSSRRRGAGAQGCVRARCLQLHYSGMCQRHDLVQAPGMIGLSHLGVGQIGKRYTCFRVSPGIRGPGTTMAERIGRGGAAKAANQRRGATHMHTQTAVHRHAHTLVDTLASVVAGDVLHRARPQNAGAIERTQSEEHLVEGRQVRRCSVTTTAGDTGTPEGRSIPFS